MNKSNEDDIVKYHKRKRLIRKIILFIIALIFIITSLIFVGIYYALNQKTSIIYTETSSIDYNVDLIPNEFYTTSRLDENVDAIASLIDRINITFNYNMNFTEQIDYLYSYKIIANLELKEKNKTNLIYSNRQEAINVQQVPGNSPTLNIAEEINLVYGDYNNQINRLIDQYKLDNTESQLILMMQINVVNKATGEKINKDTNVMTLTIPLDTKTVEIAANERVKDYTGEIIIAKDRIENSKKYLYYAGTLLAVGVIFVYLLMKYISKTRSAEKMYEIELKKILFDYKSYVQKITEPINVAGYQIVKIESFNDLLQMREEVQSPILMYTEKNELKTVFMMIKDKMLFVYILSSKLIRKKLIEESRKKQKEEQKQEFTDILDNSKKVEKNDISEVKNYDKNK